MSDASFTRDMFYDKKCDLAKDAKEIGFALEMHDPDGAIERLNLCAPVHALAGAREAATNGSLGATVGDLVSRAFETVTPWWSAPQDVLREKAAIATGVARQELWNDAYEQYLKMRDNH